MESTHPVARAIATRRSWRVFTGAALRAEEARALEGAAALAPSLEGRGAARLHLATDPSEVASLTRAATSGLVGKGNLWLRSAPPGAYAALVADPGRGLERDGRPLWNADVGVLGELLALAATDLGLGSCWMAAIDATAVGRALGLGPSQRVPAVLAVGEPGMRRGGSLLAAGVDRLLRRAVSGRRKPMAELLSWGRFGAAGSLPPAELDRVAPDGRGLLEILEALSPAARFGGLAPEARDLALVLEAMRLAPSADNGQTWRFVVVEGRAEVARVLEAARLDPGEGSRPGAAVVLLAAPFVVSRVRREEPFALIDHPIALSHAALVAELLGLAWSVALDLDVARLGAAVAAPKGHEATALLCLDREGERAGAEPPRHCQLRR